MSNAAQVLQELVGMSRSLGRPERDLVILGEGNTSALCDDSTFWVKASGTQLATIKESDFVRLWLRPIRELLDKGDLSDQEVKEAFEAAKVDPSSAKRPSVETVLHALALSTAGAKFVGHTHPTAVNALLCSTKVEEAIAGRLFPDEIVVCGPAPAYVPYTDPGLPLARAVHKALLRYMDEWGMPPKVILMQNHGMIALGNSAKEVDSVTAMYEKTCRILLGTFAFGGPHFLSEEHVMRIFTRPDEAYRRRELKLE